MKSLGLIVSIIVFPLSIAVLIYGCASGPGIRDVPQLSSTCPVSCPKDHALPKGIECCYDEAGYGWSGCAWSICGLDEECHRRHTTWTADEPERSPCGSSGPVNGRMLPTPCRHPDGRILIPVSP